MMPFHLPRFSSTPATRSKRNTTPDDRQAAAKQYTSLISACETGSDFSQAQELWSLAATRCGEDADRQTRDDSAGRSKGH